MPKQFPMDDRFISGECSGCGVRLDDAGIVMAELEDPWVRQACGPWAQESCGECTLPLSYWRLATHPTPEELAWWRDEIARTFAGEPQHPVGKALQSAIARYNLPQEHFWEIIAGMEMDLDYNAYRTFEELSLYCYRAASVVGLMAAEIFGYEDRGTLKYARDLGMAFQLTNILRDAGEDARRGRLYIPEEDLARFGVSRDDILHGRLDDKLRALLAFQAERAAQYYQHAFGHLPDGDRYRQRSGLIMAAVYQAVLKAITDSGYQVFGQRISLSPPRKMWIAWQTARREKRRHLERTA